MRALVGIMMATVMAACGDSDGNGGLTGPGPVDAAVATLTISPASVVLGEPGETAQLKLVARDASGSVLQGVTAQWSSGDNSVVTTDQVGLVTAVGEGVAVVTALVGDLSATASVNVRYRWSAVAPGSHHACGLRGRKAYCWGASTVGELEDAASETVPVAVPGNLAFVELDAGGRHTCGLTEDGAMYCWGQNRFGQLGNGSDVEADVPTPVFGGLVFTAMSLGTYHTCGLVAGGVALCWGGGARAGKDLAVGHQPEDQCVGSSYFSSRCTKTPRPVAGGQVFDEISAGLFHTCAVDPSGGAYCWGYNRGMLGNGESDLSGDPWGYESPVAVLGGHVFSHVSAGNLHSCGITSVGEALCWGGVQFNQGQLGTGRFDEELVPAPVTDLGGLVSIDGTTENNIWAVNTCALDDMGAGYCWGMDSEGQLGTDVAMEECNKSGTPVPCSSRPLPVQGGLVFRDLQTGLDFTCGVTVAGEAFCWGQNTNGQLGNGTLLAATIPARVQDPG